MSICVVLIYHRVARLETDPQLLAVSPGNFEAQVKHLSENYNVISLRQLVDGLSRREVPPGSVAITFDDGYRDNLYQAKPILEKYRVPAVVFITGDRIGSTREYWWDELERIFLLDNDIFKKLEITAGGNTYQWDIKNKTAAEAVYKEIHPILKNTPTREREHTIDRLFRWAGLDREAGRDNNLSLSAGEVRQLARGGLIEIGSHTMSHCALAQETPDRQKREIEESKKKLSTVINKNINYFSYPFGGSRDITGKTGERVKVAGYTCALSNEQGVVTMETNRYRIPRRLVRDWELDEFKYKMEYFFTVENYGEPLPEDKFRRVGHSFFRRRCLSRLTTVPFFPVNGSGVVSPKTRFQSVLHINTHDIPGGAARVAFHLYDFLNKNGFRSHMSVKEKHSDEPAVEAIQSASPGSDPHERKQLTAFQEIFAVQDLFHNPGLDTAKHRRFKEADMIHLHNLHGDYFNPFALPQLSQQRPTVWTLHDMHALTGHCAHAFDCTRWQTGCGRCPDLEVYPSLSVDTTSLLWQIKKRIYQHSPLTVVVPSCWLKTNVEKSILKHHDTRLIYNGIDETLFKNRDKAEARAALDLPQDRLILLFSAYGGLKKPWKGGHFFQDVYKALKDRRDLLFVSTGAAEARWREPGWKEVPYVSTPGQMALYYAAADLYIYPSIADNCPLAVLEAMACGTPVITFNTGGIPELVSHMQTGYVAKYKDKKDFIKGTRLFLRDTHLRKRAGIEGRRRVEATFTLSRMAENYLELYREMSHTHPQTITDFRDRVKRNEKRLQESNRNLSEAFSRRVAFIAKTMPLPYVEYLFRLAIQVFNAGKSSESIPLFRRVLKSRSTSAGMKSSAFSYLGDIHKAAGRRNWRFYYRQSLELAAGKQENTITGMYRVASLYKRLDDFFNAERWFEKVARETSKESVLAGVYFHLGEIALKQQKKAKAGNYLRRCLAFDNHHKKAKELMQNVR